MYSSDAIYEALREYHMFSDVVRILAEESGMPDMMPELSTNMMNDKMQELAVMSDDEIRDDFVTLISEFNQDGMFIPDNDDEASPVDLVLNALCIVATLHMGEIKIIGTPAEEVNAELNRLYVQAEKDIEEIGGGKTFLAMDAVMDDLEALTSNKDE